MPLRLSAAGMLCAGVATVDRMGGIDVAAIRDSDHCRSLRLDENLTSVKSNSAESSAPGGNAGL